MSIIVGVVSLMSGEPAAQALFKAGGAALGGALGTFIPIPILGTLIGETIGVFVGEDISFAEYEMLLCLAMLLRILPLNDNLSFLNKIQEKELINWDKEILRQKINKG